MHQQRRRAVQIDNRGVAHHMHPRRRGELLEQKEIAVAANHVHRHTSGAQYTKPVCDFGVERIVEVIVARPVLEQVAQDVQGIGSRSDPAQECEECAAGGWARVGEVEVGDEGGEGGHETRGGGARPQARATHRARGAR